MENKESSTVTMLKEAGILFAITLIAGIILGFVHELTREPIENQALIAVQNSCREVFEDADSFVETEVVWDETFAADLKQDGVTLGTVYEAVDASDNLMGFCIESTSSEGYGGDITIYVGVRLDGVVNGISILDISETAGLGMRAEEVLVPQFENKDVSEFSYTRTGSTTESEIDAISGATRTTKAVVNAVNGALEAAQILNDDMTGENITADSDVEDEEGGESDE